MTSARGDIADLVICVAQEAKACIRAAKALQKQGDHEAAGVNLAYASGMLATARRVLAVAKAWRS